MPEKLTPHSLVPDIHPATFGYEVVAANYSHLSEVFNGDSEASDTATTEQLSDSGNGDVEVRIQQINDNTRSELDRTRVRIRDMTDEEKQYLDDELDGFRNSEFLKKLKQNSAPESTWAEWLADGASDEQLLNTLQWHTDTIEGDKNDPDNQAFIEQERLAYKAKVQGAIDAGWLHEDSKLAIDKVDGIKVFVGDMFDTILTKRIGYHTSGVDHVVIAGVEPGYSRRSIMNSMRCAGMHEFNHAVLGQFGWNWMNEALTEHIALSLIYGKPDVIDPYSRNSPVGSYVAERELLDALVNKGQKKVPIETLTLAYSQDLSDYADHNRTVQSIGEVIDDAWAHVAPLALSGIGDNRNVEMLVSEHASRVGAEKAKDDLLNNPQAIFNKLQTAPSI